MANECKDTPQETPLQAQLRENLGEVTTWLKEAATTAGTLIKKEAPEVAKEIVARERATSTATCLLFAILAAVGWVNFIRGCKKINAFTGPSYNLPFNWVAQSVIGVLAGCIGAIVSSVTLVQNTLPAWFAPRLVILDYIRHLL